MYNRLTRSPWFVSIGVGFVAGLLIAGIVLATSLFVR